MLWDDWTVATSQDHGPPLGPRPLTALADLSPQTLTPVISGAYGFPYSCGHTGMQAHSYINTYVAHMNKGIPSLALSARRQTKIHHALSCLEGQAGRSLEKGSLEHDQEQDPEVREEARGAGLGVWG